MKLLDWDYPDSHSYYNNDTYNYISSVDIGNGFISSYYSPILAERITSAGQVYIRQIITYDYPNYIGDPKDFESWNSDRRDEIYKRLNDIGKQKKKGKQIISDIDPFGEELWYD